MEKTSCLTSWKMKCNCFCRVCVFQLCRSNVLCPPFTEKFVWVWQWTMFKASSAFLGRDVLTEPSAHPLPHTYLCSAVHVRISLLSDRFHFNIIIASFLPVLGSVSAGDNILLLLSVILFISFFSVIVDFINMKGRVWNCY